MRKKFFSILLTVAMIFSVATPIGGVYAATASLNIESAKWTDGDEITVTFDSEIKLAADAENLILANQSYNGEYSTFAKSVSANGKQVVIKVKDFTQKVNQVEFTKGSVTDADGNELSKDLKWQVESVTSPVTDATLDTAALPSDGGKVTATINGKMLSHSGYTYRLYDLTNYKDVSGEETYSTPNSAVVTFDVPANNTDTEVTYALQYVVNYWKGTTIGDNKVTVAAKSGGETTSPAITSWTANKTSFDNEGGAVTVELTGTGLTALDKNAFELEKKGQHGYMTQEYDIVHQYNAVDDNSATVTFTLPKNTTTSEEQYRLTAKKGADSLSGNPMEFTVAAKSSEPETQVTISKMSTENTSVDGKGGRVTVDLTGTGLKSLSEADFTVTKGGADAGIKTTYTAKDDTTATLVFELPANKTAKVVIYTVKALKGASSGNETLDIYVNKDKSVQTFTFDVDKFSAFKRYAEGDNSKVSRVEVHLNQLDSLTVDDDWRELIYFSSDKSSKDLTLTDEDTIRVEGNSFTITFKEAKSVPAFIVFERGAVTDQNGAINDGKVGSSAFYFKSGAYVNSVSYSQLNFDAKGGEVVVRVKGDSLTGSDPALSAKVYKNDGKAADSLDTSVTVIDDENAEIRVQLPANTTNRVQAYRIMPVVNGMNTYSTYIDGYDVVTVLPEGEKIDDGKARLASVEVNGGNDEDDRSDVYETTVNSTHFTLKCDAIIRGTNLSAKKTAVKVVDENNIEWPVLPVYECGATIRWQRSSSFMEDKASKNEQRIEFLAPRCLGTSHTYKMYFAVDGENFDDEAVATFVIKNDSYYQPEDGFTLEELGTLKTASVKYVDTNGKEIAESKKIKGYGITELYTMGLDAKEIPGYKLVKCNKDTNWFLAPTFNEEKQSYEFKYGQHFMRDLKGDDVIYTYEEIKPIIKLSTSSYTYNGKVKTPSVKVTLNGESLLSKDYTVSYASGRKNVGKYSVKVTLKNDQKASNTAYFKINPKATALKKVTKAKKAFTAKWSKQSKQVTGYQVQYSTSKKFSGAKTATVKSYKKTSKKVTKLKAKKKYYVRVRTYKTVKGEKFYSSWSKVKSVKTK